MGTAVATSGLFVADPTSASLAAASPFTRARCVSACLQADYIGTLTSVAGQIAVVRNLSLAAFNMNTGTSNPFIPMSVDEMFSYAHSRERFNLDGHEAVWRPTDSESVLRTQGIDPSVTPFEPDTCFLQGTPTTTLTTLATMSPNNVTGVAIAWRGLSAFANTMIINLVKVTELELAPRNNLVEAVPRPIRGPRLSYAEVTDYLDKNMPDWQAHAIRMAGGAYKMATGTFAPKVTSSLRSRMMLMDEL